VPYTLLLADDSVTIQRVIELTFADEDVIVIAVSDGDQAIERLEASPPDIVLADIGMPGKNGYEVAQYIRQSPRLAHIPVVLLTGAFEPVDQARANAAGCDGVLAKPFEPQMVIGRVKELLARPRRDPDAPSSERHQAGSDAGDVPTAPVRRNQLNDYFDRLDAAFSAMASHAPGPATTPAEPWDLPMPPSDTTPVDLSLSYASPEPEAQPEPAAAPAPLDPPALVESPALVAAVSPVGPAATAPPALELPLPNPPPLPALADAFAALLAAEQGEPGSFSAGIWPASVPLAATLSDELIEDVTRRVLARLSDTVVREAVSDIASKVAERLIREEIERIKASIK
jgi:CheY-like chemotaxis protein